LLAALVCNLVSADLLIILTDVDGVLDHEGRRLSILRDLDRDGLALAGASGSDGVGSGGMASKVQSAKIATRSGVPVVVASGRSPTVLADILAGGDVGTLFLPSGENLSSRKHWIAYGSRPSGRILVDDGAHRAVAELKKSLLPRGIVGVEGAFGLGDTVSLLNGAGLEFARGLAAYPADDLRRIQGLHSTAIEPVLGYKYLDEAVHRDDLVLLT
jgi:glutamate 5-kinase